MNRLLGNLAYNSNVYGILRLLAKHQDMSVRYRMAISWNTPYELQELLSGDKDSMVAIEASDKLAQYDHDREGVVYEADE